MKTQFIKNYSKNYLLLEDFTDYDYSDDFRIEMLSNNTIPGTLDFSYDIVNNKPIFKYDITSKQSFASLFSTTDISYKAFTSVVLSLIDIINFLEEYLIDINSLLISEKYIYLDPEKYTTYFIICPAINNDFYIKLSDFFNDILKKIEHDDDKLVLLAYRLSASSQKDNFNISLLKNIILSSDYETSYTKDYKDETSCQLNKSSLQDTKKEQTDSIDFTFKSDLNDDILNKSNPLNRFFNNPSVEDSYKKTDNTTLLTKLFNLFKIQKSTFTFMHNKSNSSGDLYTIPTGFYIKSCLLCGIFILIIGFGVYCIYTNSLSYDISLFIILIGVIFLIGSIKYLYELYPSSKVPFIKGKIPLPPVNTDNQIYDSPSENDSSATIYSPEIFNNTSNSSGTYGKICNNINKYHITKNDDNSKLCDNYNFTDNTKNNNSNNFNICNNDNNNSNNNNSNNSTDDYYEFGNTIILSTRDNCTNHRLVYTGTDYVDNVPINSYPFTIGKLKNSVNMVINNPLISRIHACIYMDKEEFFIEDMNSSNGTYVNDTLLKPHEKFPLKEGDKIKFSHLIYIFE